jgi:hypothetical protein
MSLFDVFYYLETHISTPLFEAVSDSVESAGGSIGKHGDSVVDTVSSMADCVENYPTATKVVAIALTGIATGGAALVAAPAIASTLGGAGLLGVTATTATAIESLSGAALTSASLAKLGWGAKIVGGWGMAGGKAVVTAGGATIGASTATGVSLW